MIRNTYIVLCLCLLFKAFSQQDSIYHRHKIWKSTIEQFEAEDKNHPSSVWSYFVRRKFFFYQLEEFGHLFSE
ncbi:exported hypothetical protein [Capnocytophaga canimorsus]|uniref:Uncharacterized protein n=1 Tax=Capnocytophaga canimorsus TaxID=28188 RepID=A0A0B7IHZ7_9FLAO|nr:exported hypothetical protein [Capnocytophaga canimorsus]